ncbi:MAG: DNA polymerase III subunit chi [Novosphingobium sp.]
MRVDFYQLSRDPAEAVVPLLAHNTQSAGERMLVVSADDAQVARISETLWAKDGFLAHGLAGGPHQERQPILLSDACEPANGARYLALADGEWRDAAEGFERVFLLFDGSTIDAARGTWRTLREREGIECNYWQQDGGKWTKAA